MCATWTVTAALFTPLLNWISSRGSHTAWSHGFTILFWLSITISFDVVPSQSHNNSKMPKDVVMVIQKRIVLSCCGVVMWCHSFLVFFFFFEISSSVFGFLFSSYAYKANLRNTLVTYLYSSALIGKKIFSNSNAYFWWRSGSGSGSENFKVNLHHWQIGPKILCSTTSQKVMDGFRWSLVDMLGVWQLLIDSILLKIRMWIQVFFQSFFTLEKRGQKLRMYNMISQKGVKELW